MPGIRRVLLGHLTYHGIRCLHVSIIITLLPWQQQGLIFRYHAEM